MIITGIDFGPTNDIFKIRQYKFRECKTFHRSAKWHLTMWMTLITELVVSIEVCV